MIDGVVFDIDDTILRKGKLDLKDRNFIRGLRDKNINVIIATGRDFKNTQSIMEELNIGYPLILLQGSLIHLDENRTMENLLDENTVDSIINWCLNHDISFDLILKNDIIKFNSELSIDQANNYKKNILQIQLYFNEKYNKQLIFEKEFGDNLNLITRVHFDSIICTSFDIDKGMALRKIANLKDWDLSKYISVGNFPSDSNLFDETLLNVVISESLEIKPHNPSYVVSKNNVHVTINEIISISKNYNNQIYSKNIEFRIRMFGNQYFLMGEKIFKKVTKIEYIIWKLIDGKTRIEEIIYSQLNDHNIFSITDAIKKLHDSSIIIEEIGGK